MMVVTRKLFLILDILMLAGCSAAAASVPPLVIVPGLGGSVLRAKLNHLPKYRDCARNSNEFTIWASVTQGVTRYDCFLRNFDLVLDKANNSVSNHTGVEIFPYDFGGTKGVEYSNAGTHEIPIPYMESFISALHNLGWVSGKSVRAATYDFRAAGDPKALAYQYSRLRELIEDTARINGGQRVHLMSHSLGGPYLNLFLNLETESWREKFVASHIAISGAWLGAVTAIEGILSGPQYDNVPQFLPKLMVPAIRSFPSIAWMFPLVAADGTDVWGDEKFVVTPTRSFSLSNIADLIADTNSTVIAATWEAMKTFTAKATQDAGVDTLCLHANDTKTDVSIKMPDDKFSEKGKATKQTFGDGTVPIASLEFCGTWRRSTLHPIRFGGSLAAHTAIVQSKDAIDAILKWLLSSNK